MRQALALSDAGPEPAYPDVSNRVPQTADTFWIVGCSSSAGRDLNKLRRGKPGTGFWNGDN